MMTSQDALDRLSAAYRVEVDEETKNRHIAEVGAAIRTAPPTPPARGFALRSRVAGAVAAVVVVVAPVGMTVAAEDAVPGEFLYPLKQVTERIRALVDDDVAATHRVEEVERLVIQGASISEITRAIERAEAATSNLVEDGVLGARLESVRERLRGHDEQERGSVARPDSPSSRPDEADPGSDNTQPGGSQNGPGIGSATTSVPQSAGHGEGSGERSTEGVSTPDGAQPPQGTTATGANQGDGGTADRDGSSDGAGTSPTTSPATTDRQGPNGATGEER